MILNFKDAQAARASLGEVPPKPISDATLLALRTMVELEAVRHGSMAWKNLADALVELQERRRGE